MTRCVGPSCCRGRLKAAASEDRESGQPALQRRKPCNPLISHAAHASWNWRLVLRGNFCGAGSPSRQPSHDSGEPRWCVNREGVRKEEL
jgi:hypothetical protein